MDFGPKAYPCPDCGVAANNSCHDKHGKDKLLDCLTRRKTWSQFGPLLTDNPEMAKKLLKFLRK